MSASNFFELATTNASTRNFIPGNALSVEMPNMSVESGGRHHKQLASSSSFVPQIDTFVQINPSTGTPSSMSSAQVDFKINAGALDRIHYAMLKIVVTNGTGSALTLCPSPQLLQQVQIWAQDKSVLISQPQGVEIWLNSASLFSLFDWATWYTPMNSSNIYGTAGTSLGSTDQQTLYIPLNLSVFTATKLYLDPLLGNFIITPQFIPSALYLQTGADPTVNSMTLLLRGTTLPKSVKMSLYKSIRSSQTRLPFYGFTRQPYNIPLVASSTYQIILTGLAGLASACYVCITSQTQSATNLLTFNSNVSQIDLQDANGVSITGSYPRSYVESCMIYKDAGMFDNIFADNSGFFFFTFSKSLKHDLLSGSNRGFYSFDGTQRLWLTTNSSMSSANYTITVYCRVQNALLIAPNGGVSTEGGST
jgi:hypothetical protein